MNYLPAFGIIALAALIHASFQLSISLVTVLSGHTIGRKARAKRLLQLTGSFLLGTVTMTALCVSFLATLASQLFGSKPPSLVWSAATGLMMGLGLAVWAFYYRHKKPGTSLWLPRGMAHFLVERTKATTASAESFSLGATSVLAEGIFVIGPASAAALALVSLPAPWQLAGIGVYTLVASAGIGTVVALIGSGHSLANLQKWREHNKRFLQFAAGSALLILGFYMYVNEVITPAVLSQGGM
ncbi:MAG: hypothetical protein WAQ25_04710 [Candidatus Saccharimonas sp.]